MLSHVANISPAIVNKKLFVNNTKKLVSYAGRSRLQCKMWFEYDRTMKIVDTAESSDHLRTKG